MNAQLLLLWLAGLVQIAIASANFFLPRKLKWAGMEAETV
jgi:hypothetical protein